MASAHYWHYGKSIRATQAEREGKYPKTAFKRVYGIDPSGVTTSTEWHHTSKMFNRTDYYNIEDVMTAIADMPYGERKGYLKGKFKDYWENNRFNYLTYEKPIISERKMHGFSIHADSIYLENNVADTVLWRAVRKAIADKKSAENGGKNRDSHEFWHKKDCQTTLENFWVNRKSLVFDIYTHKPIAAIVCITDFLEFKDCVYSNKGEAVVVMPISDYTYTLSGSGNTYYFKK